LIIDHVQLAMPAGGEGAARRFYGGILEMLEEAKPEQLRSRGGCWFRKGACVVHLGVETDFRPARKAHPAFIVPELDALAGKLQTAGHDVTWDDAVPGVRRFFTADPFGNRLEFMEAEDASDRRGSETGRGSPSRPERSE
jgi:hypothetical protein